MSEIQSLAMPYPWHGEHWDLLTQLSRQDKLPHALMLTGPSQLGKVQFARALAQRVICTEPVGDYACGNCKSCKLVAAGSHPDLKWIAPEEEGKAIKIDQVRVLCDFIAKTSQQGGWKVTVIEPAEAMNINAANALLKSLEEPSPNTLLILACHQLSRISATIRSRCRLITFALPDKNQSLSWLNQVISNDDHDCEQLLEQAGGRPLQALKLLESDLLEQRSAFYELLQQLADRQLSAVVAAEKCCRAPAHQLLEWLTGKIQTTIRTQLGAASSRNWFRILDRVQVAQRELNSASNPNPQLLWESLLLDWQMIAAQK